MDPIEKTMREMPMLSMVSAKQLEKGVGYSILRVPGGWIFVWTDTSCFVPEEKIMPVSFTTPGDPAEPKPKKTRSRSKKKEDN